MTKPTKRQLELTPEEALKRILKLREYHREYQREYQRRPEVAAKRREYQREYQRKYQRKISAGYAAAKKARLI